MEIAESPSSTTSKRSSAIDPSNIHNILIQGNNTTAQPSPVEHISSSRPTSAGFAATQQSGQPFLPALQPVVRTNRFSLTFPVLPPSKEVSPIRRSISPVRDSTSPVIELANIPADPSDGNFLTAIAAQERRVLEIKEELSKAEAELDRLKLLWATHEAQKKKSESRRVTKLRPLSVALAPSTNDGNSPSSATWQQQQEMERRRALLTGPRASRGTVFSGSRHTRTLSLLTPMQKAVPAPATSPNRPRRDTSPDKTADAVLSAKPGLPRAATTSSLVDDPNKKAEIKLDLSELGIDKDMVLNTGKKVAMNIKDGLWTFWEDLRQATVGEDVIPPQHLKSQSSTQTLRSPRKGTSKGSLRGSSKGSNSSRKSGDAKTSSRSPAESRKRPPNLPPLVDISDPAVSTETVTSPKRTPTTSKKASKHIKSPSVAVSTASSDAWDGWDDSPGFSRSSSATSQSTSQRSPAQEVQTPSKVQTSPETVTANDPLPWPALSKFGGATLRRTASTLMSEWDKLSPPAGKTESDGQDFLDGNGNSKLDSSKQD